MFAACFDANGGVFEPLLGEEDAIISDSLNHASIIDGVRLCKAKRYRFANSDLDELEDRLKEADAAGARFKLIATRRRLLHGRLRRQTEGDLRPRRPLRRARAGRRLPCDGHLAKGARHAGADRRWRPRPYRHRHIGKTLGGGMGGFVAAPQPIVDIRASARGPISRPGLAGNRSGC